MSIWSSLLTGSSGLNAFGSAIGVVGDNIANVSTIGFKGSRANFEDVLGGSAMNGQRIGNGVRMSGPETMFGQGALQQTGRSMDLAIRGEGFFVVRGALNGMENNYFSRDGRFGVDSDGTIVNSEGLRLQGYSIDVTGVESPSVGDLRLDVQSPPHATENATMSVNLDASTEIGVWDPNDPQGSSQYSTSMTVYDSLGNAHRADVYFVNQGGGAWEWHAMVDGAEVSGGTPGEPTEIASGELSFTSDGLLDSETMSSSSVDFNGATGGQVITFDFGDAIADGGTGMAGSTQYAAASNVTGTDQDGAGSGNLIDVAIGDDGTVTARYSNGQSRPVARVALATFGNEGGLVRAGNQLYSATSESGEGLIAAASAGGRGAISSGALEQSNVDLGSELVTLIAYQRAFQANARTISTADEMLSEIANLKR